MEPAVQLSGVTKRFGDVVAVDALDLQIRDGEFFSLLGPVRVLVELICSSAPITMMLEIALVTLMSGVCSAGVTFQITM